LPRQLYLDCDKLALLASIKDIGKFFMFIVGGLVAIIVGSFMIRGTMHMWDKPENGKKDEKDND